MGRYNSPPLIRISSPKSLRHGITLDGSISSQLPVPTSILMPGDAATELSLNQSPYFLRIWSSFLRSTEIQLSTTTEKSGLHVRSNLSRRILISSIFSLLLMSAISRLHNSLCRSKSNSDIGKCQSFLHMHILLLAPIFSSCKSMEKVCV